jgi:hypothetical protein
MQSFGQGAIYAIFKPINEFTHPRISAIHVPVKSFKSAFARKGPDAMTEELVAVLSRKESFEFKPLFDLVYANLRARNAAGSSEEMLRLRIYEKLQHLVAQGAVKKTIAKETKKYRGTASLASVLAVVPAPV